MRSRRGRVHAIAAFALALALIAACEDQNDYFKYSFIDTVLAPDTISNGEVVPVVHVYPAGCNDFERFESREIGDTLVLAVLYHFYYNGMPCAHGSGLTTKPFSLSFATAGRHFLKYDKNETLTVVRPIYVKR